MNDSIIIRRMYLNQLLSWLIRGRVNNIEYTRSQIISMMEGDKEAANNISEYEEILVLLKGGEYRKELEIYVRRLLI